MSGHLLRVEHDQDSVLLTVECHAEPDADCHMVCANPDHEDACNCTPEEREKADYCNPCQWLNSGDCGTVAELYAGDVQRFPLTDGMPIEVRWENAEDGYVWELTS